ncbi:hypothetical protein ACGFIK_06615 [Micromonospora sp. NPDC048871]|uniref:hypothetical protein n=1 Tax=Micromonospora sp. NPDC048871 TaxID=3364259 RepID=UPI00371929CE
MPKRLWTISALFLIIIASLVMIFSGSLDGAAAWANIIALPVAITGVTLTLRGLSDVRAGSRAQDRNTLGRPMSPASGAHGNTQIGFAQRDQINVGRDYYGSRSDGR